MQDSESEIIHFVKYEGGSYLKVSYNKAHTLCKKFRGYGDNKIPAVTGENAEEVTCPDCLKKMECKHIWRFIGTGRHGSDKGVDSWQCVNCGHYMDCNWYPHHADQDFIANVWDDLTPEQQKQLAFNNFKVFNW